MDYIFNKENVNLGKLTSEISELYDIDGLSYSSPELIVHSQVELTTEDLSIINTVVNNHNSFDLDAVVDTSIASAESFGKELMKVFKRDNVKMGITQAGKTLAVSTFLHRVEHETSNGSLYASIQVIATLIANGIPADLAPFVTAERMTDFSNKIKVYLGIPL